MRLALRLFCWTLIILGALGSVIAIPFEEGVNGLVASSLMFMGGAQRVSIAEPIILLGGAMALVGLLLLTRIHNGPSYS